MRKKYLLLLSSLCLASAAMGGEPATPQPAAAPAPQEDQWKFSLASPIWVAGLHGDIGIGKLLTNIDVPPDKVVKCLDMTASFRGEASYGKFGLMGDFLYMSISDGVGTPTVVKKVDLQVDQSFSQLAPRWRIYESPRASVDIYAGARYVYLHQRMAIQGSKPEIAGLASNLATGGDVYQRAKSALSALNGKDPSIPIGPIGGAREDQLARKIASVTGTESEKADKIAKILKEGLNGTVSRTDWWIDPFIGLRAKYNLTESWYLLARGDVGGFGVGSDFTWDAEASVGCQITKNAYAEVGYRALGTDYEGNGLVYNTISHGVQLNLGFSF